MLGYSAIISTFIIGFHFYADPCIKSSCAPPPKPRRAVREGSVFRARLPWRRTVDMQRRLGCGMHSALTGAASPLLYVRSFLEFDMIVDILFLMEIVYTFFVGRYHQVPPRSIPYPRFAAAVQATEAHGASDAHARACVSDRFLIGQRQGEYYDSFHFVARMYVRESLLFDILTSVPVSFIEYNTWRQCLSGTDDPNTSRGLRFVRMLKPLKLFKIFRILKLGKVTTVRLAHLTRLMSAQNSNVIATVTATRVSVTTPGLPRTLAAHRVPPAVGGLCSP